MQVTICGGGNAAHVLAGLLGARQDLQVNVYTPLNDEAQRWQQGIQAGGGITLTSHEGILVGQPYRVSADPAAVIPGSKVVILALPAFAHELILRDIVPYLGEQAWLGALPARGGFDWSVEHILMGRNTSMVVFGLQTLPWACRIQQYGREVAILGTKAQVDLAAWPSSYAGEVAALLADLMDVYVCPIANFLSLTLANTGQLIHPGVMYGLFQDWHGQLYTEAPLFYQGVNATTADILQQLSGEVQALRRILERYHPDLDLSAVRPLDEWLRRSYAEDILDASSLQSSFSTNRSYAGLRAPMRPLADGWVPDFQARYLAEDVPYGLIVIRGIAELADLPTPMMDRVIAWAQMRLGKEYLVGGKLNGGSLATSRAPQRYGIRTLDGVVRRA